MDRLFGGDGNWEKSKQSCFIIFEEKICEVIINVLPALQVDDCLVIKFLTKLKIRKLNFKLKACNWLILLK